MNDRGLSTEYRANSTWIIHPRCTAPQSFLFYYSKTSRFKQRTAGGIKWGNVFPAFAFHVLCLMFFVAGSTAHTHTKKLFTIKALEYSMHKGIILSLAAYVLHMLGIGGGNRWAAPQGQKDLDVGGEGGGEKTRRSSRRSSSSVDKLCIPSFCSSCVCRNLSPRGQTASVEVQKNCVLSRLMYVMERG